MLFSSLPPTCHPLPQSETTCDTRRQRHSGVLRACQKVTQGGQSHPTDAGFNRNAGVRLVGQHVQRSLSAQRITLEASAAIALFCFAHELRKSPSLVMGWMLNNKVRADVHLSFISWTSPGLWTSKVSRTPSGHLQRNDALHQTRA